MVKEDLGWATIVYDHPDEGTTEETVDNEHIAYFQDHWIVKIGESDAGHDTVRRIPAERVHYVERNVEAFEEEVRTLANEVQSIVDEFEGEIRTLREQLGDTLPGQLLSGRERREAEPHHIDIEESSSEGSNR